MQNQTQASIKAYLNLLVLQSHNLWKSIVEEHSDRQILVNKLQNYSFT